MRGVSIEDASPGVGPPHETMASPEGRHIRAALAARVGPDADSAGISQTVVDVWTQIDVALTPIVGARGVAALHGRSLFLTAREFPWMGGRHDGVQQAMDLDALRRAIAAQSAPDALLGASALFEAFDDLLSSMVGAALTQRLLRAVWDTPYGGEPAQDSLT